MKNIKMSELISAAFLGGWSGMVLFVFIGRSETWAIIGGFIGAAIQIYQDVVYYRKKREPDHNSEVT
jgi:NADH:ubiquinone oxidoreductase subunit H